MKRYTVLKALAKIGISLTCIVNLSLCYAHESRPISIDITETAQHIYSVKLRVPASVGLAQIPRLAFPLQCKMKNAPNRSIETDAFVQHVQLYCQIGLMGAQIKMVFPAGNPALSTLFRLRYLSGEQLSHVLKPGELLWHIPEVASWQQVILDYTQLGVMHIGTGFDHLLFVACLLFIAKTRRRIILIISGFTLAHSLTLLLATLDWLRLPVQAVQAVEAVIALSIVFLATEIAKGKRNSWTFQYPIIVSSCFGLLHGFGFATVLTDIGLPQTELLLALLFFNVGIEFGQLCFVALAISSYWVLHRIVSFSKQSQLNTKIISVYLIGTVSCFWLFERLAAF